MPFAASAKGTRRPTQSVTPTRWAVSSWASGLHRPCREPPRPLCRLTHPGRAPTLGDGDDMEFGFSAEAAYQVKLAMSETVARRRTRANNIEELLQGR